MVRPAIIAATMLALAACDRTEAPVDPQRVSLEEARGGVREPLASPDTENARWTVAPNGQAVAFGNLGERPFLSLACRVKDDPPTMRVIRHVEARPGEKALFPVLGNGTISRFKADAALEDDEWRWQAVVPADDPLLEVFTGAREIEATLPGAGSLIIAGSRVPGEFISWCRRGGAVSEAVTEERTAEAEAGAN
ncbi:MAG: hypothetical protein ACO1OD_11815 [Croceibacterium sp.]